MNHMIQRLGGPVLLAAAGCASSPDLAPARPVQKATDDTAIAREGPVRLLAESDAWESVPRDLDETVTPIEVTVRNVGAVPVEVRYESFVLDLGEETVHPMPPYRIDQGALEPSPVNPTFASEGYAAAPYYRGMYSGISTTRHPFAYDYAPYYRRYARAWRTQPSRNVMAAAMPEGTIEPGGFIRGFLYFEHFEADDVPRTVELSYRARNARDGDPLPEVSIPFRVREE